MNKFKTLLLGTAAATIAATGAQAADAPMREPVYRCDITGFIELPGTDICFKVGGFARLVVWANNEDFRIANGGDVEGTTDGTYAGGPLGLTPGGDDFGMYAQARLNFDARRSTDHGTVRAFIEMQATDANSNSSGPFVLRHAFAQLGNWVFGKTWSTFLHGASDPNGSDWTPVGHTVRVNQIRYTHSVGNGLTVSVAVEDQAFEDVGVATSTLTTGTAALSSVFAGGDGTFGQNSIPTIVGNINYANGGWDVQLSGLVKFNEFSAANGGSDTGYGVMLGVAGEVTEGLNAVLKVAYTNSAPQYQMDWFDFGAGFNKNATGDDHEQFGIMGGFAGTLTDTTTWQIGALWGTEDNTGSTGTINTTFLGVNRDYYGVQGVLQYRPASGFDFLAEIAYLHADFNAGDLAFGGLPGNELDALVGGVTARVSF